MGGEIEVDARGGVRDDEEDDKIANDLLGISLDADVDGNDCAALRRADRAKLVPVNVLIMFASRSEADTSMLCDGVKR